MSGPRTFERQASNSADRVAGPRSSRKPAAPARGTSSVRSESVPARRSAHRLASARDRERLRSARRGERMRVEAVIAAAPHSADRADRFEESLAREALPLGAAPPCCPVCASSTLRLDEVGIGGGMRLAECLRCDYRWTAPRPPGRSAFVRGGEGPRAQQPRWASRAPAESISLFGVRTSSENPPIVSRLGKRESRSA